MKKLNNLQDITILMKPYFEESALAGDRTKIWVSQDVYDRYSQALLEFWDILMPGIPKSTNSPILYRGMELVVREDMSDEKQD